MGNANNIFLFSESDKKRYFCLICGNSGNISTEKGFLGADVKKSP